MSRVRTSSLAVLFALTIASGKAQEALSADTAAAAPRAAATDVRPAVRTTQRVWLWGLGRANILDTYLSPLEYTGANLTIAHRTERLARWGRGHVTTQSLYTAQIAYVKSPTDDGKEIDGEFTAAGGWHYNWHPAKGLRLAAGGLMEMSGGGTYNSRGSNNPAQGRLGASLAASALAEYRFPLFKKQGTARVQIDGQLAGVQFSPEYGQSYYEIFSLGHNSGIIHFTHPGNCPTVRLSAELALPVLGAQLTLGYLADVRQSELGGLKRHAWRNSFMIGYTRRLHILR